MSIILKINGFIETTFYDFAQKIQKGWLSNIDFYI